MKRIWVFLTILSICCGASIAAPKGTSGANSKQAQAKAAPVSGPLVGLITQVGDQFNLKTIGVTAFGNEEAKASVPGWGLDAVTAAKIASLLKPRFSVVRLQLSKDQEAALDAAPGSFLGINAEERGSHICSVLQKASSQHFEYYLRIRKAIGHFYNTNQDVDGIGIVRRDAMLGNGVTFLHTIVTIELLDGKTCQSVRDAFADGENENPMWGLSMHGAHREIDASWKVPADKVAQDARLKDATKTLLEQTLARKVPEVFAVKRSASD